MIYFVILSAGKGSRLELSKNKGLVNLSGKTLLEWNIEKVINSNLVDKIIVTTSQESEKEINQIIKKFEQKKLHSKSIIIKGSQRQDSSNTALEFIKKEFKPKPDDIILFHNVANPFFETKDLKKLIKQTKEYKAAALAQKCKDTIRKIDKDNLSDELLERQNLWQMQTPQALQWQIAVESFRKAYIDNYYGTDDIELAERIGCKAKIVECGDNNFKITTPKDLELAKLIMNQNKPQMRTGIGQDSHRFSKDKNKPLTLGGIILPDHIGLEGNSDADVILHSIFNAISQSLGRRSIGYYADPMCLEQGITDSKEYLKVILEIMKEEGYGINNLGIMLECKTPKIEPIHDKLKKSLAKILEINEDQIGITATTGEGLTDFGKGLGVQCLTNVLLKKFY